MKTGNVDDCSDGEPRAPVQPVELVADLWPIIMSLLSPSDVVRLSLTCKALFEYSQCHPVWHGALVKHHFLPKSYPHLLDAPTRVIRRQLITTARLDAAFSQGILKPTRSYSFPLNVPGVFRGLKFIPGGDWLVLLFHSQTPNSAQNSNICLFNPRMMESGTTDTTPASVTLQCESCWSYTASPYKSSRGDDLMVLRTFIKNDSTWRFLVCHLDTKKPLVKITFMVHTTLPARDTIAAHGDYLVYGWITDDRRRMLRIMKLNEDYTKLTKDVIAEIDWPLEDPVGNLALRYDLRLSGKQPRLLLGTKQLVAAYDISDDVLTFGCQSSPLKLQTVWKYVPEDIAFGPILRVFHENAIVMRYGAKFRFVYPDIDSPEPNAKTITTYDISSPPSPYNPEYLTIFTSQRLFWYRGLLPSEGPRRLIEAAMIPAPSNNSECKINRVLVDHDELAPRIGGVTFEPQDWDELSGKLCLRFVRNRFPHDYSWRNTSGRITILEMV